MIIQTGGRMCRVTPCNMSWLAANDGAVERTPEEQAAGIATSDQCAECPTRHCEQCAEKVCAPRVTDRH